MEESPNITMESPFRFLFFFLGVSILIPCHRSKGLRTGTHQLHKVEPELSYRSGTLEHYVKCRS